MQHIDFSRVFAGQKWRALNIFQGASSFIFISSKKEKIKEILEKSVSGTNEGNVDINRNKAAKLESLGKVDEFGEQSVFG